MANKKVGILTLQYALNYGGVLQTYATKEILKSLGYVPVIIDRIPDGFPKSYVNKRRFIHPITNRSFQSFRANELRPITKPIRTSGELTDLLKDDFYAIVIGSDQVWRKEIFPVNGDYFMIHQKNLPIKKIAFAASTGVGHWQYDEKETYEIADALRTFCGLSVRESDAVSLFKEHCGLDIMNILDPTLIADSSIYTPLCNKANISGKGKLVTYILDWTERKNEIITKACRTMGLEAQHILSKEKKPSGVFGRIFNQGPTVYDWVNQIATADYVVTDSFHGMAFSIIFNKQFTVIGNPERGMARFTSLLSKLGLTENLITENDPFVKHSIDYKFANALVNDFREKGVLFLKDSLSVD